MERWYSGVAKKARSRSGSVWRLLAVDVGVAIKRNHFLNVARNEIGLAHRENTLLFMVSFNVVETSFL